MGNLECFIPYQHNNKKHDQVQIDRIAESIKEFGFNQPLVVDEDGVILVGHARRLAAMQLGLEDVPVIYVTNLSADQKRAYRILDNKLSGDAEWNYQNLEFELNQLGENGFDLDKWGLNDFEFPNGNEETKEDEFGSETQGKLGEQEFDIKLGDIIRLNDHEVLCGDSTDEQQISKLMQGRCALLFTSPPYVDVRDYDGDDITIEKLAGFLDVFSTRAGLLCVNLGIIRRDSEVFRYWDEYIARAQSAGLKLLSWNIWDRGDPCSIGQQTAMSPIEHEFIFVFGKERKDINLIIKNKSAGMPGAGSNRQKDGTTIKANNRKKVRDNRALGTILRLPKYHGSSINHPAIYPIELPVEYIKACSKPGDYILDPFLGSGTTLIAADQLKRICYGAEISPKYCDIIIRRFRKYCTDNNKLWKITINDKDIDGENEQHSDP